MSNYIPKYLWNVITYPSPTFTHKKNQTKEAQVVMLFRDLGAMEGTHK